jgi:WD40 repeat protein
MRHLVWVIAVIIGGWSALAAESPVSPILRIETGMHGAVVNRLAVADGGRTLITVSDDKTTRLWSSANGAPEGVWRTPIGEADIGALYALAAGSDIVAVGGLTGEKRATVYIFDRKTGRLQGSVGSFAQAITALALSPDGRFLAVGLQGKGGIVLLDLVARAGAGADAKITDGVDWLAFAPDGRLAASLGEGDVRLYGPGLKLLAETKFPKGERPWGLAFTGDGSRLGVGSFEAARVRVYDGKDLKPIGALSGAAGNAGGFAAVAWSEDGSRLAASGSYKDGQGRRLVREFSWPATKAGAKDLPVAGDTITDLGFLPDGAIAYASAEPSIGVIGKNGQDRFRLGSRHADFRDGQAAFLVSADGSRVEFPTTDGDKGRMRFDVIAATLSTDLSAPADLTPPKVDDPRLKIGPWRNATDVTVAGRKLALEADEHVRAVAILPGGRQAVVGTDFHLRLERPDGEAWSTNLPAPAWAVNASADGRFILAALGDGSIRWYQPRTGAPILSLFVEPRDRRWVLWRPEGYFDHSRDPGKPGGETLVGYQVDRGAAKPPDFVSIGQLYDRYYRRDLVIAPFTRAEQAQKLVARAVAVTGEVRSVLATGLPPRLELQEACVLPAGATACAADALVRPVAGNTGVSLGLTGDRLYARYTLTDRGGGLGHAVVRRDGSVVEGKVEAQAGEAGRRVETLILPLSPETAKVEFSTATETGAITSPPEDAVTVTLTRPAAAPPPPVQGVTLYLLATGVSQYREPAFRLANAARDASALADLLRKPSPPIYERAEITTLLDADATNENIAAGLEKIAAAARPQDIVLVFFSGHGESVEGKYFFAPVDFGSKHKALLDEAKNSDEAGQTEIIEKIFRAEGFGEGKLLPLLARIQGNLLLVLDTCFSATLANNDKATRAAKNDTALNSVGHETGRSILAAARNLAQDSASGGNHGLFTTYVLKGLEGEADLGKEGKVNVADLLLFVKKHVGDAAHAQHIDQEPFYYFSGSNLFDLRAVGAGR